MVNRRGTRRLGLFALSLVAALVLPAVVMAHAELETSTPADGATVPSPFNGPIILNFSAVLADGSKADLHGPDGGVIASATVDAPGATMTIALAAALPAGDYQVKWVSVAEDTDLERGTIAFTVAAAPPSPSPTPEPTPTPAATATPSEAAASVEPPTAAASPAASASPVDGTASNTGDVVLPIVVALIVVGAGAAYLLTRRNRPTISR